MDMAALANRVRRVNTVITSFLTVSEMAATPLGRIGELEELASAAS
jgi:hypothetical protein